MTTDRIAERLAANGIPFSSVLPEQIAVYMRMLTEWNSRMDLTAVTEEEETLDRHFVDSLMLLKTGYPGNTETLIDVGTGAGFPGLVIALACPGMKVTLLDAQQKRLDFLQAVCDALSVQNVTVIHGRAEDGARRTDMREKYDLAVARAVAPLNVLCEYLLPYVRIGGMALCWKGPGLRDETETGRRAAFLLGGETGLPIPYQIIGHDWEHVLMPVKKVRPTPKGYPRKAGTPKNKPLG